MSRQDETELVATRFLREARRHIYISIGALLQVTDILVWIARIVGENLPASLQLGRAVQLLRETLHALHRSEAELERVEAVSTRLPIVRLRSPPASIYTSSVEELDVWIVAALEQRNRLAVLRAAYLDTQP